MSTRFGQLMIATGIVAFASAPLALLPAHAAGQDVAPMVAEPYEPGNAQVVDSWQFTPGETQANRLTQSKWMSCRHHHCPGRSALAPTDSQNAERAPKL